MTQILNENDSYSHPHELLVRAIRSLAGACDYARQRDGIGYNKPDTTFGHWLASLPADEWLPEHETEAYIMLRKYHVQLNDVFDINYDDIPRPTTPRPESRRYKSKSQLERITASWEISDLYTLNWSEPRRVDTKRGTRDVRKFPLEMLGNPNLFWNLWKKKKEEIKKRGFSVGKWRGRWELSWWVTPSDVEEENEEEEKEPIIINEKLINDSILYDYQKPHAIKLAKALAKFNVALDGSDTGTGKTFSALVALKSLGLRPLVICPKAVIPGWITSCNTIDIKPYAIMNYALARRGKYRKQVGTYSRGANKGYPKYENVDCPILEVVKNPKKGRYESKYLMTWKIPDDCVIVFDEAHRCKNRGTQNTQLMTTAVDANAKILMLSATIAENPLKMAGSGKALGFYKKPWEFFTKFVNNYGCHKGRFGWVFNGSENAIMRIHKQIYESGKGDRMRVEPLIKAGKFPETQIIFETYDVNSNANKINQIYSRLGKKLREIRDKKDCAENALAARQKARQEIELLKVPMIVQLTNDLLEENNQSVVIFVNYTDTLRELCKQLDTTCTIFGGNDSNTNEKNREAFQAANNERIIICNVAAAREGIDLHDIHGNHPRVALITPDDNAQNLKQCLGRVHRAGGTRSQQRILFAANTIEEEVCDNCRAKINNINTINDGDLAINF